MSVHIDDVHKHLLKQGFNDTSSPHAKEKYGSHEYYHPKTNKVVNVHHEGGSVTSLRSAPRGNDKWTVHKPTSYKKVTSAVDLKDKLVAAFTSTAAKDTKKAKGNGPCKAYLNCTNKATTTHPHSILGDVPSCQRCADRYASLSRPRETASDEDDGSLKVLVDKQGHDNAVKLWKQYVHTDDMSGYPSFAKKLDALLNEYCEKHSDSDVGKDDEDEAEDEDGEEAPKPQDKGKDKAEDEDKPTEKEEDDEEKEAEDDSDDTDSREESSVRTIASKIAKESNTVIDLDTAKTVASNLDVEVEQVVAWFNGPSSIESVMAADRCDKAIKEKLGKYVYKKAEAAGLLNRLVLSQFSN